MPMRFSIIRSLVAADACGRLDAASLPTQAKMELLIAGFAQTQRLQDKDGGFGAIEEWPGLTFDKSGAVTKIQWSSGYFDSTTEEETLSGANTSGSIDFRFLPDSLDTLEIASFGLKGTLTTALLPRPIWYLDISENRLSGEFDTAHLPPSIIVLEVHKNKFVGEFQLDALPHSLERIDISNNRFSGPLDFTKLTAPVEFFYADSNKFCDGLDVSKLPPSLRRIWVLDNNFKQDTLCVDVSHLHASCGIRVDACAFGAITGANGTSLNIEDGNEGALWIGGIRPQDA